MIVPSYRCSKPDQWTSPRPYQDISVRPPLLRGEARAGFLRRLLHRH